ncbi:MAG: Rap1a/Tai family immunity protein [Candidatus Acidiferrales bacterium]
MKTTLGITILVLFLFCASVAWAGKTTASLGEKWCNSVTSTNPADNFPRGICVGYMSGWKDATENPSVVFEDGVTNTQMAKVFIVYMQNHPEEENKPLSDVLMRAMENAGLVKIGQH